MVPRIKRFVSTWWSVAIAVIVGVAWLVEIPVRDLPGNDGVSLVFAIVIAATFAYAAWAPTTVAFVIIGGFALFGLFNPDGLYESDASGVIAFATIAVIGTLPRSRDRLLGIAASLAGGLVLVLGVPERELDGVSRGGALAANLISITVVSAVAWIIADRVRATRELRARAARLEKERDAFAKASVADERARIARELHDVVAHSVSVMTVQAGGVRRLLGDERPRERDALAAIEETGRTALAEMRRMVGVMRAGDGGDAQLAPQPGLGDLDRLATETRDAGLPVQIRIDGEPRPLGAGLDLSAFRIVQEGLTNARKHAGPAHATVTVRYRPTEVELLIEDDGVGPRRNGAEGHGLIGMGERVAVYGGHFEHGPRSGGGFRVHATLPIDGADSLATEP